MTVCAEKLKVGGPQVTICHPKTGSAIHCSSSVSGDQQESSTEATGMQRCTLHTDPLSSAPNGHLLLWHFPLIRSFASSHTLAGTPCHRIFAMN